MKLQVTVTEHGILNVRAPIVVADMTFEEGTLLAFAQNGLKQMLTPTRTITIRQAS